MYLTFPSPASCQHNHEKSSVPLRQDQSHSYPHTPPDRRDASAKGNPPPENQQVHQLIQENKNSKNTPLLDSSGFSNAAAILWPL